MISSPSAFTQRVYGVSFSVLNLFANSSETTAFLAIWLSLSMVGYAVIATTRKPAATP